MYPAKPNPGETNRNAMANKQNWTDEPWEADERHIFFGTNKGKGCVIGTTTCGHIGTKTRRQIDAEANANADRIVACVNALKGFTTDDLNDGLILRMVKLMASRGEKTAEDKRAAYEIWERLEGGNNDE